VAPVWPVCPALLCAVDALPVGPTPVEVAVAVFPVTVALEVRLGAELVAVTLGETADAELEVSVLVSSVVWDWLHAARRTRAKGEQTCP
jgi:hypothetical protein